MDYLERLYGGTPTNFLKKRDGLVSRLGPRILLAIVSWLSEVLC